MLGVFYPGTLCPENWPDIAIDRAMPRKRTVMVLGRGVLSCENHQGLAPEVGTTVADEDPPLIHDNEARSLALRANRRTVNRTEQGLIAHGTLLMVGNVELPLALRTVVATENRQDHH